MAEVITGEAVPLELPVATFPSRMAALLIDMAVQYVAFLVFFLLLGVSIGASNSDYLAAAVVAGYVLIFVGYPTIFETLSRGKTLGKMALGIRVVGDDGSPERFRQALVRALVGLLEIWSYVLAPVALITSILSAKAKRVGDLFAGTYVVQQRVPASRLLPPEFAFVPLPLADWAQFAQVAGLSDQTADAAGSYLRRFRELGAQARDALGIQLATAVAAQVSPPPPAGTPPAAYLAAVLAVRRQREAYRLGAASVPPPTSYQQPAPPSPPAQQAAPATPAAATPAPATPAPATPAPATPAQPGLAPPA